ncbi:DUF6249 domain-containing protein [Labilibacter marinus]|uniref:DUF6249 domain-containing protein n=1 Tax=Labilibacter marinus TaxID=1477105 RepID=UPI00094FB829|nr:DUF6249 domain-containing protein [Labilibacter marinus]
MVEIIVPVTLFGGVFTMIIMLSYFKNRRMERTSLIAAGKEASIFNEGDKKPLISQALKFGILFIGVGLGLLVGDYLANSTNMEETIAYLAPVCISGGISLLVYYLIQNKLDQKNKEEI